MAMTLRPAGTRRGSRPERLRRMLERLGPTFIKIGQYLALRPDLLDAETCNELLRLVDRVPAEPMRVVRRVIEEDLGGPIEEHFAWIAMQPIAAGSLAQVYEARTHSGAEVAIKVQRSDVAARVERDLRRLHTAVRALRRFGFIPDLVGGDLVEELRRWMAQELDLEQELANLTRMRREARDSEVLVVPRPYPAHSGRRVVTATFLRGIPFSVILRLVREGRLQRIGQLGLDRRLLAEGLIEAMLEQLFRYRIFQADSHPGNIIALPGNAIGFVDFGLVETLDPVFERSLLRYLRAVYLNDAEEMLGGLEEILVKGPRADFDAFRRDFFEENRRLQLERGRAIADGSPIGRYIMALLRAARRHDLRLPTGILAIYRSLLTAELVAHQLASDVDLASVGRAFFEDFQRDSLVEMLKPDQLRMDVISGIELLRSGPRRLDRLLSDLAGNRFRLNVVEEQSLADRRLRSDQVRLLVAALVFVGLAVLTGATQALAAASLPLALLLWGALGANALWIVLLWRRLP